VLGYVLRVSGRERIPQIADDAAYYCSPTRMQRGRPV
jgi:hypothetical protein